MGERKTAFISHSYWKGLGENTGFQECIIIGGGRAAFQKEEVHLSIVHDDNLEIVILLLVFPR